jgi:hypothetical protein
MDCKIIFVDVMKRLQKNVSFIPLPNLSITRSVYEANVIWCYA